MAYQRERTQTAPERDRHQRDHTMSSMTPAQQMLAALRPTAPAFVTPPPVTEQRSVREGTRATERFNNGMDWQEKAFFDQQSEREQRTQEDESYYRAFAHNPGDSNFHEPNAPVCACGPRCQCKPACKYEIHSCPCAPCVRRPTLSDDESFHTAHSFESTRSDSAQQSFTGHTRKPNAYDLDRTLPDRSFSSRAAKQAVQPTSAPRYGDADVEPLQRSRSRAQTNDSDQTHCSRLAYVPTAPKTPSRKKKDTTPLEFFGSRSGQRYPAFGASSASNQSGLLQPPAFSAGPGTSELQQAPATVQRAPTERSTTPRVIPLQTVHMTEKVEPARGSWELSFTDFLTVFANDTGGYIRCTPSPPGPPRQRQYQHNFTHASLTGGRIDGYSPSEEYPPDGLSEPLQPPKSSPGVVTYPQIPRSTSAGMFHPGTNGATITQSLPSARVGNPRDPELTPVPAHGNRQDWFGRGRNLANDSVPQRHSSPASSSHECTPPAPPPLPLPQFIAPRPATKQRYVSAGGNAKLEDRPEIKDFVLPPSVTPGMTMTRDLLLQRLDSAPQYATPPRTSASNEFAIGDGSARSSYETDAGLIVTKRDRKKSSPGRKDSSTSQKLARFKRAFSYGNKDRSRSPPS